jgi:hypothetical protein
MGQARDTAAMNGESGRSIEWVIANFTDAPMGSISYTKLE